MNILIGLFFVSTLLGQLTGFTLSPGVVVYVHDIFLVLLWIFCILPRLVRRQLPALVRPMIVFVVVCLVSLLVNNSRFLPGELLAASLYLLRWILYAGVYIIVVQHIVSTKQWLWWLFLVGSGFALIGLAQYVLYPDLRNLSYLGWDPHYYRVFSTLLDPNFTGILLVLTLLVGLYLHVQKNHERIVWMCLTVSASALLLTYSRSSFLALVAGWVVWSWFGERRLVGVGVVGIFLVLLLFLPRPGGEGVRLMRTVSSIARVQNWQESITLFTKAPIFGYGFNTLRFIPRPSVDNTSQIVSRAAAGLDNSFLFVLVTTGMVGLAAYLWLWVCVVQKVTSHTKRLVFASLAAVAVHSLFINSLFYPQVMIWLWVLVGVSELTAAT